MFVFISTRLCISVFLNLETIISEQYRPLLVVVLVSHLLVISATKVEQSPLIITRRVVLTKLLDNDKYNRVQPRDLWSWLTLFCSTDLDHVIKRLFVSQTETLADVQHVYLRTGNHDPDQGVVSGTESLEMIQRTDPNRSANVSSYDDISAVTTCKKNVSLSKAKRVTLILHMTEVMRVPSLTCKGAWQRTWERSWCTELWGEKWKWTMC